MSNRLDALAVREGKDGKNYFNKIGAAFETKNGGWSVVLDCIPAPVDGQFKILLMEPRERSAQAAPARDEYPNYGRGESRAPQQADLDDEVPF